MYTATVPLTILSFTPYDGTPSSLMTAQLQAPISGPGSQGIFSGDGQSVTVRVPAGYGGLVQINYQLNDPNYVLTGIAVDPTAVPGGVSFGRQQLPSVVVNRDSAGSQLIVTDACLRNFSNVDFNFLILVQCVNSGDPNSGRIGAIDPDIENETEN